MLMNDYQAAARATAIYPNKGGLHGLVYCALKLNGEAGEVAENVGKAIRDDRSLITADRREKLLHELGDVLWYIANTGAELDLTLEEIAAANLVKLNSRKERGVLHGSGDSR